MASRIEDLEKQLEELKKAKNLVLNSLSGCDNPNDSKKDQLWKAVVPFLRTGIENTVKLGVWDKEETKTIIFDKIMKLVFGNDILENLEKL